MKGGTVLADWRKHYLREFADMDLIDRKQLLKDMGLDTEEKRDQLTEKEMEILSYIDEAETVDPVEIVEEFEQNFEDERNCQP